RQAVQRGRLVVGGVALDEAVADEVALDRGDRSDHARVVAGQEPDEREGEHARVQALRAVELRERVQLGVEAAPADLRVDLGPSLPPPVDGAVAPEALARLHAPVERDPRHHLRVREVTARPAYLPDSLVRLLPDLLEVREHAALQRPGLARDAELVDAALVER